MRKFYGATQSTWKDVATNMAEGRARALAGGEGGGGEALRLFQT